MRGFSASSVLVTRLFGSRVVGAVGVMGFVFMAAWTLVSCTDGPLGLDGSPAVVPPISTRLALREGQACVLPLDSIPVCWGSGGVMRMISSDSARFIGLSGGVQHICGISADSSAYCWGRNGFGQLGDGTFEHRDRPVKVVGARKFVAVAGATTSSCALDAGGALWCWGSNEYGGLANGDWGADQVVLTPRRARTSIRFVDLSGDCALGVGGLGYCWSTLRGAVLPFPFHREPGNCTDQYWPLYEGRECLVPTTVDRARRFVQHAGCWLGEGGAMYCTGEGDLGHLGDGRSGAGVIALRPVAVAGGHSFVTGSGRCAIDDGGVLFCWGSNALGRLGIGEDGGFRAVPTPVASGERFVEVAALLNHCARTAVGAVWCWGSNANGELGPGFVGARSNVPVLVTLPD